MKKESKKFKVKSRDKQSKTTGVRHSDDDVKICGEPFELFALFNRTYV